MSPVSSNLTPSANKPPNGRKATNGPAQSQDRSGGSQGPQATGGSQKTHRYRTSEETSSKRSGELQGSSTGCGPHRSLQAQGRPKASSENADLNNRRTNSSLREAAAMPWAHARDMPSKPSGADRTGAIRACPRAQPRSRRSPIGELEPDEAWDTLGQRRICARLPLRVPPGARRRPDRRLEGWFPVSCRPQRAIAAAFGRRSDDLPAPMTSGRSKLERTDRTERPRTEAIREVSEPGEPNPWVGWR